ncbi:MAG TPA: serine/threonine-protein kinase [Trebonia sp.]
MAAGAPPEEPDSLGTGLPVGALVGGYRLEGRIGNGGMATVFRARDEKLGRVVALKVLSPAMTLDAAFRERFIRESEAASLVDHPNIIPVYAAGEDSGVLYLAMRHVSGGDLHSVVEREGPLAPERAAALLAPVASALDAAHRAGIVHRDVKPGNVLVDANPGRPEHPYLSDFGLAKRDSLAALTIVGEFIGTPSFASPEQISGESPRAAADQYALACVAFTILTASLPFRHRTPQAVLWAQMSGPPPQVTPKRSDLSPDVDDVLARALARDPRDRYPTCSDFAEALSRALSAAPGPGASPPRPPVSPQPSLMSPARSLTAPRLPVPETIADPRFPPAPTDAPSPGDRSPRAGRPRPYRIAAIAGAVVLVAAAVTGATLLRGGGSSTAGTDGSGVTPASGPAVSVRAVATLKGPGSVEAVTLAFGTDETLEAVYPGGKTETFSIASGLVTQSFPLGEPIAAGLSRFSLNGETLVNPEGGCAGTGAGAGACTFDLLAYAPNSQLGGTSASAGPGGAVGVGDSAIAITTQAAGQIRVWYPQAAVDLPAGLETPGHTRVQAIALSPDGGTVAATSPGQRAGSSHPLYVWSTDTSKVVATATVPKSMGVPAGRYAGPEIPIALAGTTLAVSDYNTTNVYNANSGRLVTRIPAALVAVSPDGTLLLTTDPDDSSHMDIRDSATGTKVGEIGPEAGDTIQSVAFSQDGRFIAASCGTGNYVWQITEAG